MRCLPILMLVALGCQPPPQKTNDRVHPNAAQYEAEIAHLRERAQRPAYTIINAHEHLYKAKHLPTYLAAARQHGIKYTVIVTSPELTVFGKGDKSYKSMAKNWLNVQRAVREHPGEILPFFALDPADPDVLQHAKEYVAQGAYGVKLYSGHSNFYDRPLDDPNMEPVFAYLEEIGLPINWHINLMKFHEGFDRVMQKHPRLNVMVPHFGVGFWRPRQMKIVTDLMHKYPSMYVDTSLGTREILIDGQQVMAQKGNYEIFEKFFDEFQDRIIYGSDSVITGNKEKTTNWFYLVLAATRDQLETESFTFPLAEAYSKYYKKGRDPTGRTRGFALPKDVLTKIYYSNASRWIEGYKKFP